MAEPQAFRVVVNDEQQYSLWPATETLPPGWRDGGAIGTRDECLTFIREHWADMRPVSVRSNDDA